MVYNYLIHLTLEVTFYVGDDGLVNQEAYPGLVSGLETAQVMDN